MLEAGEDVVRVRFEEGDSFDAYRWSPERANLEPETGTRINFARPHAWIH
ncbi:MAG: hypothetical protein U0900_08080 [Myxococcota bacterium]